MRRADSPTGWTLREALLFANDAGDADTIDFAPGLAGQAITLTTAAGTSVGTSALVIDSPVRSGRFPRDLRISS